MTWQIVFLIVRKHTLFEAVIFKYQRKTIQVFWGDPGRVWWMIMPYSADLNPPPVLFPDISMSYYLSLRETHSAGDALHDFNNKTR